MIERIHLQELEKRLTTSNYFIQILMGPRQVGKTTLVGQLASRWKGPVHHESADALIGKDGQWIEQQWNAARLKQGLSPETEGLLIIDEIQKISNWSEQVKACWDADRQAQRKLKVILLGSSSLLLQKGMTESLAGRFETMPMTHWSFNEMNAAWGWTAEQYAWFGGYPGAASLIEDESRWKNYIRYSLIDSVINRDILMLNRVDKPALLRGLFEIGCQYSSQILSLTKILGQLQDKGNVTTLAHYLDLLDQAGLLTGIDKYCPDIARQRASIPKFQVKNNALFCAMTERSYKDFQTDPTFRGRVIESAIGTHLINHQEEGGFQLYYWRERADEVDFIIRKSTTVVAIEVKSNSTESTKGMKAFSEKYKPQNTLLVGDRGLNWQEFLRINPADMLRDEG